MDCLLNRCKQLPLHLHRLHDGQNEERSLGINTISKPIWFVSMDATDATIARGRENSGRFLIDNQRFFHHILSFSDSGILKNACQIQSERSIKASNITVGFFSFPLNCTNHAVKQFFHVILQQLMLLNSRVVPRLSDSFNIFFTSSSVGARRCIGPSVSTTVDQIFQSLPGRRLRYRKVVVDGIERQAVIHNTDGCRDFHVRVDPQLAKAVALLLKAIFVLDDIVMHAAVDFT